MRIPFFSFRRYQSGSLLVDVMVSVAILSMGITAGASIISNTIQQNAINKNRIIAVNLAREGVEVVRILRDTNWLRYGESARICWNFWSNTNQDTELSDHDLSCYETVDPDTGRPMGQNEHPFGFATNNPADSTYLGYDNGVKIKAYLALFDPATFQWMLVENFYVRKDDGTFVQTCDTPNLPTTERITTDTDCSVWTTRKTNSIAGGLAPGLGINEEEMSRLYIDNKTGLYTHKSKDSTNTENIPTNFYREIYLRYNTADKFIPLFSDSGGGSFSHSIDNQILVESKVWYPTPNGEWGSVILGTELTDYLNRNNWND